MRGYLLDTNIISELRKGSRANKGVIMWFERVPSEELFLSVFVIGEIRKGIERIRKRDPISANALSGWLKRIRQDFSDNILPISENIAELWGELGMEQPIPPIDGLLAATALYHSMALVTRNVNDFRTTPVQILNPFK